MPILSYLHQLFNADTCHAYLHTLRWQDRPLQCPRCQRQNSVFGVITTTGRGSNATGSTAVGAPSTTLVHRRVPSREKSPLPPFVKGGARSAGGFVIADDVDESCVV